nr:NepR family anti-sigma factor [Methylobacterium durans]
MISPDQNQRSCLTAALRAHLGNQLRACYGTLLTEQQPQRLLDLIKQLESALSTLREPTSAAFRDGLLAAVPRLHTYAMSLTGNAARADDLVQEALLKAWSNQHSFVPGSNLNAWLFTILRNQFYTECRKGKREVEDADGAAAERLIEVPDQEDRIELQDVWSKVAKLPALQREALLLVSVHDMTYEAAAEVIGCQVGTVKSRVSRGRALLSDLLGFAGGRLSRAAA